MKKKNSLAQIDGLLWVFNHDLLLSDLWGDFADFCLIVRTMKNGIQERGEITVFHEDVNRLFLLMYILE